MSESGLAHLGMSKLKKRGRGVQPSNFRADYLMSGYPMKPGKNAKHAGLGSINKRAVQSISPSLARTPDGELISPRSVDTWMISSSPKYSYVLYTLF